MEVDQRWAPGGRLENRYRPGTGVVSGSRICGLHHQAPGPCAWGKDNGYTLDYEPPGENRPASWKWYHGANLIAEARHNRGLKGNKAVPCDFAFYRPDGSLLRDETGWPSLQMIRWYRPDGETVARVETGSLHEGAWRPREWCWYDRHGQIVRNEHDSNGDGIPDVYGRSDLASEEPQTPLSVDHSWAVNGRVDSRRSWQPRTALARRTVSQDFGMTASSGSLFFGPRDAKYPGLDSTKGNRD